MLKAYQTSAQVFEAFASARFYFGFFGFFRT